MRLSRSVTAVYCDRAVFRVNLITHTYILSVSVRVFCRSFPAVFTLVKSQHWHQYVGGWIFQLFIVSTRYINHVFSAIVLGWKLVLELKETFYLHDIKYAVNWSSGCYFSVFINHCAAGGICLAIFAAVFCSDYISHTKVKHLC